MSELGRFADLKKFTTESAHAMMVRERIQLKTPIAAPETASVPVVLAELESGKAKDHVLDILHLMAHGLPKREATWWACLAGRDLYPKEQSVDPLTLSTAEAWVYKPSDKTRSDARTAMENAMPGDKTKLCALAATFAPGTLGPGDLEDYEAPPGAVGAAVFGMVLRSLYLDPVRIGPKGEMLIERGLDIARGGNGRVEPVAATG
ncbi:MAG: hypothetical protein AAGC57_02380 [Pseudomonadota bacterium]